MLSSLVDFSMLAGIIGGWEIVAILFVVVVLFSVRRLLELRRGLRIGLSEFLKASDEVSHDAGKSLGGIFGKPAAQALTPDNQTAELYDPDVFRKTGRTKHSTRGKRFRSWRRLWRLRWYSLLRREFGGEHP